VSDATTIWLFRERHVKAKVIDQLFARFNATLMDQGYLAMGGQIIDATVVPTLKQHNTETGKAAIGKGRVPENRKPTNVRQKDCDARWSIHGKARQRPVKDVLDPENIARSVWADAAYRSAKMSALSAAPSSNQ
jgi:transposase, IS5 family